jgi:acetoin utilization protein AcuB
MRVRDWMSPDPVTVSPSTTVAEARGLLRYYGIRHLPVVDRGRVVGMVSDRDVRIDDSALELIRAATGDPGEVFGERRDVSLVMSSPVHVIGPDEAVEAAARALLSWRISALPVIDAAGALVGLITTTDCLLASLSPAQTP